MQLDHISILVKDLDQGIKKFTKIFGAPSHREDIPGHEVEVVIFQLDNSKVELICPYATNVKLQKRLRDHGEGLHHMAIREKTRTLSLEGLNFVESNTAGAEGNLVKFLHPKEYCGTLVELVRDMETECKQ